MVVLDPRYVLCDGCVGNIHYFRSWWFKYAKSSGKKIHRLSKFDSKLACSLLDSTSILLETLRDGARGKTLELSRLLTWLLNVRSDANGFFFVCVRSFATPWCDDCLCRIFRPREILHWSITVFAVSTTRKENSCFLSRPRSTRKGPSPNYVPDSPPITSAYIVSQNSRYSGKGLIKSCKEADATCAR